MAQGARRETSFGVAAVIEAFAHGIAYACFALRWRQLRIIGRDFRAVAPAQPQRDPAHHGVVAPAVRIIVELAVKIAGVEPGQARTLSPVAFARQSVTRRAGGLGAAVASAERDRLARRAERAVMRRRAAARQKDQKEEGQRAHSSGTIVAAGWFPLRQAKEGPCAGQGV